MKKNLSLANLSTPVMSIRGIASPQNSKKVQGFDKAATIQSFTSKIQQIKTKPKRQSLEDQYVKGLQDEIHYLEMELKLLKEKQIAKHSQVDQLQTFFGDGIPINQNILALKNGFNNYRTEINKKIASLEAEKKERESVIQGLGTKVSSLAQQIHQKEKKYKDCLTEKSQVTHDKVKKQALLKQQSKAEDENLRVLKNENRKLAQSILAMQRTKEILTVGLLKIQNSKFNKLNKLRQSIAQKQKQFEQLAKNYEQLKKQQDEKSYVIMIEEQNVKLKKKIIALEKQFSSLTIKAEEKKMELEEKLKERHKEIMARMDIQLRLNALKQSIDRENSMKIQDLEKFAKQKAANILEGTVNKNKKLSKYVSYYTNLLAKVEDSIHAYGQKKPDLKRELEMEHNQVKVLEKDLQKQKVLQYELTSQIQKLKSKSDHISQIVPPLVDSIKKEEEKIRLNKSEKERLYQEIKMKEKQLELTQILKSLSLEQTQISSSSNSSIQDRLIDFMRNWEAIHRA